MSNELVVYNILLNLFLLIRIPDRRVAGKIVASYSQVKHGSSEEWAFGVLSYVDVIKY